MGRAKRRSRSSSHARQCAHAWIRRRPTLRRARRLGLVHGEVGVAHESLGGGVAVVARGESQADAGRHVEPHAVHDERRAQAGAQPVGQVDRLRHADDVTQDDHELVAADAGDQVAGPHVGVQAFGHLDQQFVAVAVSERVVDQLEAVEVEVQDGHVGVVDGRLGERSVRCCSIMRRLGRPVRLSWLAWNTRRASELSAVCSAWAMRRTAATVMASMRMQSTMRSENVRLRSRGSARRELDERHPDDRDTQPRRRHAALLADLGQLAHGHVQGARPGPT